MAPQWSQLVPPTWFSNTLGIVHIIVLVLAGSISKHFELLMRRLGSLRSTLASIYALLGLVARSVPCHVRL